MNGEPIAVMVNGRKVAKRLMLTHMLPALLLPLGLVLLSNSVAWWVSGLVGLAIGGVYHMIADHALHEMGREMFFAGATATMESLARAGVLDELTTEEVLEPKP